MRPEPGLRLGGYTERWVFSPDRREAAFGLEFGELVIVDLPKMELRARLRLGNPDVIVRPIGWPRPDLLFALVCRDAGKYGCSDNRLLLIDPKGPVSTRASSSTAAQTAPSTNALANRSSSWLPKGSILPAS